MSEYTEIVTLVEGQTEKIFISDILVPYLAERDIFMRPVIISKPGQKGGDIKFARVKNDIELHLKQRSDTYLTIFIDYYGIKNDWPGLKEAKEQSTPKRKAEKINHATRERVNDLFGAWNSERRFIPYVSMHEFEALLFSEPQILAEKLSVSQSKIDKIIADCGEPENIDDSPQTAPSKRLEDLSNRFKKTSTGITIAKEIGLTKIRERCPIFTNWLKSIEDLRRS